MTIREIVNLLLEKRPQSKGAITRLGLHLDYLDEGAFRNVYRVRENPRVVVKIPKSGEAWHAREEITAIDVIRDNVKFEKLRKYLPKVYYVDYKSGIIVMKRYAMFPKSWCGEAPKRIERRMERLEKLVYKLGLTPENQNPDIHSCNVGYELGKDMYDPSSMRFLDLGLFS